MIRESSADYLMDHVAGRYRAAQFPYVTPYTNFHELMTAEFSPLIELDASNGLSPILRDKITTTGDGSVTESSGELLVASGATAGSTATLATQERGRYQPGIVGLAGHAVRRPTAPTGDQELWWEYGDGTDGVRVGEDANGYFVQFIHGGTVDDKVYQANWNVDNLTGEGGTFNASEITLDMSQYVIWRMPYTHYGVGPVTIEAYLYDADGQIMYVPVHEFRGYSGEVFWENPKLPLREHVDNGTTGGNLELYIGGRHFAVLGRYSPNRRNTPGFADNKSVTAGVWTPVCSFQKKTERKWATRSVKVAATHAIAGDDVDVAIILGATLTGASWGAPPLVNTDETALEFDQSATSFTGGTAIDGMISSGGVGNDTDQSGIRGLGTDIPDDAVVTVAVRTRNGSDTTAGAVFVMEEEA